MNLLLLIGLWFHPFYVSVFEMNHNAQAGTVELTIRCFADDLEECLRLQNKGTKPNLVEVPRSAQTDSLVIRYIRRHLQVTTDGKNLQFNFVGAEMSEGNFWIYLEADGVPRVQSIKVVNDFLYECRKEQNNIHHLMANGKRQGYKLDNPANNFEMKF